MKTHTFRCHEHGIQKMMENFEYGTYLHRPADTYTGYICAIQYVGILVQFSAHPYVVFDDVVVLTRPKRAYDIAICRSVVILLRKNVSRKYLLNSTEVVTPQVGTKKKQNISL